jgi:hypothetical protein
MSTWLRRIRGAIGMGLTWALAWFVAGVVLLFIVGFGAADVPFPLGFGMFGFFAGAAFSGVLGLVEGRRRFDQMSLPRFAGWGAVGGLVLAVIFVLLVSLTGENLEILVLGPVFAVAGAGSAAGSLALARMSEDRQLPHDGVAEAGLSEDEVRESLGGSGSQE